MLNSFIKFLRSRSKGEAIISFAIAAIVFFALVFGIIDLGILAYRDNILSQALESVVKKAESRSALFVDYTSQQLLENNNFSCSCRAGTKSECGGEENCKVCSLACESECSQDKQVKDGCKICKFWQAVLDLSKENIGQVRYANMPDVKFSSDSNCVSKIAVLLPGFNLNSTNLKSSSNIRKTVFTYSSDREGGTVKYRLQRGEGVIAKTFIEKKSGLFTLIPDGLFSAKKSKSPFLREVMHVAQPRIGIENIANKPSSSSGKSSSSSERPPVTSSSTSSNTSSSSSTPPACPDGTEECPDENNCCPTNGYTCLNGNNCCPNGRKCGSVCCADNTKCVNDQIGACCPNDKPKYINNVCCPSNTAEVINGVCCTEDKVCGSVCCGPNTFCADKSQSMCCQNGTTLIDGTKCCPNSTDKIINGECCPENRVCENECCKEGAECKNGSCTDEPVVCPNVTDVLCPSGGEITKDCCDTRYNKCLNNSDCCPDVRVCDNVCCPEAQYCIGGKQCCPNSTDRIINDACCEQERVCNNTCCSSSESCIDDIRCCPNATDKIVGGECCEEDRAECNGRCCPSGESCIEGTQCCPNATDRLVGEECCEENREICNGRCCPAGQSCIDNECKETPPPPETTSSSSSVPPEITDTPTPGIPETTSSSSSVPPEITDTPTPEVPDTTSSSSSTVPPEITDTPTPSITDTPTPGVPETTSSSASSFSTEPPVVVTDTPEPRVTDTPNPPEEYSSSTPYTSSSSEIEESSPEATSPNATSDSYSSDSDSSDNPDDTSSSYSSTGGGCKCPSGYVCEDDPEGDDKPNGENNRCCDKENGDPGDGCCPDDRFYENVDGNGTNVCCRGENDKPGYAWYQGNDKPSFSCKHECPDGTTPNKTSETLTYQGQAFDVVVCCPSSDPKFKGISSLTGQPLCCKENDKYTQGAWACCGPDEKYSDVKGWAKGIKVDKDGISLDNFKHCCPSSIKNAVFCGNSCCSSEKCVEPDKTIEENSKINYSDLADKVKVDGWLNAINWFFKNPAVVAGMYYCCPDDRWNVATNSCCEEDEYYVETAPKNGIRHTSYSIAGMCCPNDGNTYVVCEAEGNCCIEGNCRHIEEGDDGFCCEKWGQFEINASSSGTNEGGNIGNNGGSSSVSSTNNQDQDETSEGSSTIVTVCCDEEGGTPYLDGNEAKCCKGKTYTENSTKKCCEGDNKRVFFPGGGKEACCEKSKIYLNGAYEACCDKDLCGGKCCQEGQTCEDGECKNCNSPKEVRAGVCVCPVSTDTCGANNCCTESQHCNHDTGECVCQDGSALCNGECCQEGQTCEDGQCKDCNSPKEVRDGVCVCPVSTDTCGANNCCTESQHCNHDTGECVCQDGRALCNGACCPSDQTCEDGECKCPEGQQPCGEICCQGGETCEDGKCKCPEGKKCGEACCTDTQTCDEGKQECKDNNPCCNGKCVQQNTGKYLCCSTTDDSGNPLASATAQERVGACAYGCNYKEDDDCDEAISLRFVEVEELDSCMECQTETSSCNEGEVCEFDYRNKEGIPNCTGYKSKENKTHPSTEGDGVVCRPLRDVQDCYCCANTTSGAVCQLGS